MHSKKAKELIEIVKSNPYQNPPPYEKLVGNLSGSFSRRINRESFKNVDSPWRVKNFEKIINP